MNCVGCTFSQFPRCAIQSIITAISLENLLSGNYTKEIMYPVCHKNAQQIDGSRMTIDETCDNCLLCDALCVNCVEVFPCTGVLEKTIFSDINRFNMYLKQRLSQCTIGTEIKGKGNAREKRIDIVIKKENIIYLIKTLTDIDKTPYYSRSYMDLIEYYSEHYGEYLFRKVILIPQKHMESARTMGYDCYTVDDLILEILEV